MVIAIRDHILYMFNTVKQMQLEHEHTNHCYSYYVFTIQGDTYKERKNDFLDAVNWLHVLMTKYDYDIDTLSRIEKWITSKATSCGCLKQLKQEGTI